MRISAKHWRTNTKAKDGTMRKLGSNAVFRFFRAIKIVVCALTLIYVTRSVYYNRHERGQSEAVLIDIESLRLLADGDRLNLELREYAEKERTWPAAKDGTQLDYKENVETEPEMAAAAEENYLADSTSSDTGNNHELPKKVDKKQEKPPENELSVFFKDLSYPVVNENGITEPVRDDQHVILVWWPPAYLSRDAKFLERVFRGDCGNCRITMERKYLGRSAAVLFDNVPSPENLEDLPPERSPDQAYVLWHRETPTKTYHLRRHMSGRFDSMFNYTMSYRRDADIVWFLGNAEFARRSIAHHYLVDPPKYVQRAIDAKRHLAVWVVSNCNNTRGAIARKAYVDQLIAAGLEVDLYGSCFGRAIPKRGFYDFLLPYRFYLAFENSFHCRDYVTEKFWRNGLMANAVPVVWGPSRADLAAVAPAHSYIHSEDFESPQELVDYLHLLAENEPEYRKYLDWRTREAQKPAESNLQLLRPGYEPAVCKLCMEISKNGGYLPPKRLESSVRWLFGDESNSTCLKYSDRQG